MSVPPRVLWMFAAAVAAVAAYVAAPDGPIADGIYLGVAVAASALAWLATRGVAGRWTLRMFALGVTLSGVGDVLYDVLVRAGSDVDVSLADIGWIAAYVAIAAGLFGIIKEHGRGGRADVDGLIDLASVFVVALLLAWQYVVAPTLSDTSLPMATRVVWSLYPALDAALLALVVRTVVAGRVVGRLGTFAAAGVACWLVSDTLWLLVASADSYSRLLDAGWLLGALLLAAAVWQPTGVRTAAPALGAGPGAGRVSIALVPLLIPPAIELQGYVSGRHPETVPLLLATVVLVALAFARAVRLFNDATAARDLVRTQQRFSAALAANSSDAVVVLDRQGRIVGDAPQFAALVGRPDAPTAGLGMVDVVRPFDPDAAAAHFARALRDPGAVVEGEFQVHADDRDLWLGVRLRDLTADPDVGGLVCNIQDITARKLAEARLSHQAFHDALTGLANRALFLDRLDLALRRAARTGLEPAVVYLDLDGFKDVNDSLGHAQGDGLLIEVARRLVAAVRSVDTVARLGGDEFAVLIEQSERPVDEAVGVSARILGALHQPIDLGERPVIVSASLGIAVGEPLATATSLLRDADIAMYHAKETGRDQAVVFDAQMLSATVARIAMENELAGALAAGQFHLVYQPVVTLDTERLVGFEALLRWDHPTLGPVAPDTFIPVAEEAGLIGAIGAWVLDEACRTVATWQAAHPTEPPITIAVNVSGRQFASAELVDQVAAVLASTGLPASALILEMTETALVQDAAGATTSLRALRELGVRLAIDDFGTGYSSLSYLRQFPVDILKIDRSFIDTITERRRGPADRPRTARPRPHPRVGDRRRRRRTRRPTRPAPPRTL